LETFSHHQSEFDLDSLPIMMDVLNKTGVPDGFALQLCNGLTGSTTASKQGNLWIGGYDSSFTTGPMQWVSIVEDAWYVVTVNDITVNGVTVSGSTSLNNPQSIIDSGTTQLVIATTAGYTALISALQSANAVTFGTGVSATLQQDFWNGEGITSSGVTINTGVTVTIGIEGPSGNVPINVPLTNIFLTSGGFTSCQVIVLLSFFFPSLLWSGMITPPFDQFRWAKEPQARVVPEPSLVRFFSPVMWCSLTVVPVRGSDSLLARTVSTLPVPPGLTPTLLALFLLEQCRLRRLPRKLLQPQPKLQPQPRPRRPPPRPTPHPHRLQRPPPR